jgi:hypothetical protein
MSFLLKERILQFESNSERLIAVVSKFDIVIYFLFAYCIILSGKIAIDAYYILTRGSLKLSL